MNILTPVGKNAAEALQWVKEHLEDQKYSLPQLIDQAAMRFDLNPNQSKYLSDVFKEEEAEHGKK